jgi:hypothetical protein
VKHIGLKVALNVVVQHCRVHRNASVVEYKVWYRFSQPVLVLTLFGQTRALGNSELI